jgi:transposase
LIAELARRGIAFSRVNPRQAREFARATGVLAKTDRVDDRVLAETGTRLALPVTIPVSPARARRADFLRRRRQLVEMRKAMLRSRALPELEPQHSCPSVSRRAGAGGASVPPAG